MIKLRDLLKECDECGRDWNHGHDHEASMAKNELRDMISNASKIDQMVGEGDNLPGWVSAYISLASDYMHSVSEYLAGETSRMQKPGPGYGMNIKSQLREDILELKQMSKQLYSLLKKKGFHVEMVNQFNMPLASSERTNPTNYTGAQIVVDDKNEVVTVAVSPYNVANILVGNKPDWTKEADKRFGAEVDDWLKNKEILAYVDKLGNELTQTIKSKYPNMIYGFNQTKDFYILRFGYGKTRKGGQLNPNKRPNAPNPAVQVNR